MLIRNYLGAILNLSQVMVIMHSEIEIAIVGSFEGKGKRKTWAVMGTSEKRVVILRPFESEAHCKSFLNWFWGCLKSSKKNEGMVDVMDFSEPKIMAVQ